MAVALPFGAAGAPEPSAGKAADRKQPSSPARGFLAFPDFARRREGDVGRHLRWNPRWPKFGLQGWLTGAGFGATAAVMAIIGPIGSNPRNDRLSVDEAVRDALKADSEQGRRTLRDISDALLVTTVSYSLVDALLVAGWFRRSPEVAKQMALIDIEVFGVTQGVLSVIKSLANRQRPYGRICGTQRPEEARDCESSDRYYSFPSGHTGHTFAAAAANCAHHIYLGVYGSRWADGLSCAAGFALASGTGMLRIAGDQHYLTDVLAGAGIGTLVGFAVPWLFHYRHGRPTRSPGSGSGSSDSPSISFVPLPFGAAAAGRF